MLIPRLIICVLSFLFIFICGGGFYLAFVPIVYLLFFIVILCDYACLRRQSQRAVSLPFWSIYVFYKEKESCLAFPPKLSYSSGFLEFSSGGICFAMRFLTRWRLVRISGGLSLNRHSQDVRFLLVFSIQSHPGLLNR